MNLPHRARRGSLCRAALRRWLAPVFFFFFFFFFCFCAVSVNACAARPRALVNPGASTVNLTPSRSGTAPLPAGDPWPGWASVPEMEIATPAFIASGHFAEPRTAMVLANRLASEAYRDRRERRQFPEGAVIVESYAALPSKERVLFVMEKRGPGYFAEGDDWSFAVVREGGSLQAEGQLAACARCHAEAPSGGVFGAPEAPAQR